MKETKKLTKMIQVLTCLGKAHDKYRSLDRKSRKIQSMSTEQVDVERINTGFLTQEIGNT